MVNNKLAFDFIQKAKTKKYNVNDAQAEIEILDYILENRLNEDTVTDLTKDYSFMYTCLFCREEIKPPEGIDSLATISRTIDNKPYVFTMCNVCTKSYYEHKNKLYGEDTMARKKLDRNRNGSDSYGKYLPVKVEDSTFGFDKAERAVTKKIAKYVETGIFDEYLPYVPDGSKFDHCVFCDLDLSSLPIAQSKRIELLYVPVGQSNRIHGPVKVCPSCSAQKRTALKIPSGGHFNLIKSVTCSVTGKPYTVTLEEYNSGDYSGNIILHGSTGYASQQANRKHWGSNRFEYPTCEGCNRTFVKDKLFILNRQYSLCSDCMGKNKTKSKSKLPMPLPRHDHGKQLQNVTVSLDPAIACIISEVECTRGDGTSFLLTFVIKLGFINKMSDTYPPEVYQKFIELIPLDIKNGRLLEDVSSFFERCPDRGSCYCNASIEQAAIDAGDIYASQIWSSKYQSKLEELVSGFTSDTDITENDD